MIPWPLRLIVSLAAFLSSVCRLLSLQWQREAVPSALLNGFTREKLRAPSDHTLLLKTSDRHFKYNLRKSHCMLRTQITIITVHKKCGAIRKKGIQELSKQIISIPNKNEHVLRLEYSPHLIFWWNCSAFVKIIRCVYRCNSAVIVQRSFFDVVLPGNLLQWMSFYRFQKAKSVKSSVVNYVKLTMWVY